MISLTVWILMNQANEKLECLLKNNEKRKEKHKQS